MAERVIKDTAFGKRYALWSLGKFIPTVGSFYLLWDGLSSNSGSMNWQIWLGIVMFVGGILMWALQERRMFRNYRCPQCNKHLPESTISHPGAGDSIMFHCDDCNVTWDTTLRVPR